MKCFICILILNAFLARFLQRQRNRIEKANRTDLESWWDFLYIYIEQFGEVLVSVERYAVGYITIHKILRIENIELTWILVYTYLHSLWLLLFDNYRRFAWYWGTATMYARKTNLVCDYAVPKEAYFSFFAETVVIHLTSKKQNRHDPSGNTFKFV